MWEYTHYDELYHYGVVGMKWGRRRYQNKNGTLTAAGKRRQAYKDAQDEARSARKEYGRTSGFRIKGIAKATAAEKKMVKANTKALDAKAKYKAGEAKNAEKAAKAEMKTYVKGMGKTGLVGSYNDRNSGGQSTAIYNSLKASKGKAYADKVQQKVQNQTYAKIATAATVTVGLAIASAYLQSRG